MRILNLPPILDPCFVWFIFLKKKGNNNKRSRDLLHNCPGTRREKKEEGGEYTSSDSGQLGKSRWFPAAETTTTTIERAQLSSVLLSVISFSFFRVGRRRKRPRVFFLFIWVIPNERESCTTPLRGGFLSSDTTTIDGPAGRLFLSLVFLPFEFRDCYPHSQFRRRKKKVNRIASWVKRPSLAVNEFSMFSLRLAHTVMDGRIDADSRRMS